MGRKTGLLLANVYQGASRAMWRYAAALSAEHPDDTLIILPGGRIGFIGGSEYLRNTIYDLADAASLDGAMIWSSSLTGAENSESIASFVKGIAEHLPVVSMCLQIPGIPSVTFDAYTGIYNAVRHFVTKHGKRKVAFIRGPASHRSAEERYKAYLDALVASGIPVDDMIITSPRPWSEGAAAARELLDERKLKAGKDFDAVVAASDLLVLGAEPVFRQAGISIPEDIGISGFNDNEENQLLDVELTTVRMPTRKILETSYSLLFDIEDNGPRSLSMLLPSDFIIRRSCGCSDSLENAKEVITDDEALRKWVQDSFQDSIAAESLLKMLDYLYSIPYPDPRELSSAVSAYFESGAEASMIFQVLRWSEQILGKREIETGRKDFLMSRIAHSSRRLYAKEQQRLGEVSHILDTFKTELLAQRSYSALPIIMQTLFPSLGITGALLMLYEDFQYTRMEGGFSGDKLYSGSVRFPRRRLVPESLSSFTDKGTFVVEPLFYEKQELGYILIASEWCESHVLEDIRASLSSAIKGISLTEVAQKAAEAAEEGERKANEFYSSVSEALRGPLSAMHRMLSDDGIVPRDDMASEVRRAEHMLSLSLAEFGELDFEKTLVSLSSFCSHLESEMGASVSSCGELPSVEMDSDLIAELVGIVGEESPVVDIKLGRSGVILSIKGGRNWRNVPTDPSLLLVSKIALLHSGEISFDDSGAVLVLPYPTLSGHAGQENPGPVVWLSADDEIPSSLLSLSPCFLDEDSASSLYEMEPKPSVIAWRSERSKRGEGVLKMLRSHRFSRSLPFIAYGINEKAVSLSVALECDRERADDTVVLMMPHLHRLEKILSDFGSVEDGLGEEDILSFKEGTVRFVVLSVADSGLLSALRRSKRFSSVPILIVKDGFTENEIDKIADFPNVLIANSSIIDAPDFIKRLVSVLGGGDILPPLTGALVKRAIAYINRHISHQISRWQLAESVNISEDYLTRIFRREMGVSPWDYLTRCRVGVASDLLVRTGASLGEIAVASGFQDQAYFSRVFRKIMNCSPGQYRHRD